MAFISVGFSSQCTGISSHTTTEARFSSDKEVMLFKLKGADIMINWIIGKHLTWKHKWDNRKKFNMETCLRHNIGKSLTWKCDWDTFRDPTTENIRGRHGRQDFR